MDNNKIKVNRKDIFIMMVVMVMVARIKTMEATIIRIFNRMKCPHQMNKMNKMNKINKMSRMSRMNKINRTNKMNKTNNKS